uniref:Uncharacterized protein n=1 Tax=Arundo donax TaxID=35708 RepID=A0A0A8Y4A8_ARUDO
MMYEAFICFSSSNIETMQNFQKRCVTNVQYKKVMATKTSKKNDYKCCFIIQIIKYKGCDSDNKI